MQKYFSNIFFVNYCPLFPVPCSLFPVPCSRLLQEVYYILLINTIL
ncbi:MAG: hypothetical protein F6K56_15465 [Moorea sp. SIO3G5]|nr:hypothetical protein [Moorena sp. SIO3G5]